jgi:ABC-type transport system involved in multi-copper enzyme maturation permease subunit
MFLVIILSASVVGSEYGWGTIRQLIARGTSRTNYLTAKLLTIVLVSVAGIVLVLCAGFIATIITTMLVEGNIEWSGFSGDFLISLVRILLILAVYLAFAACFAVLLRSPMSGIAVVAAWYFGEAIILALLSISTGWWAEAAKYFIGYNINHLLLLGSSNPPIDVQPWWRSAGILFGYIAVFICAAYYFLRRQDLTA